MSYLRCVCLFVHSGVQHILCCVFVLFFFVLSTLRLPVSLDCTFVIAPSVFSNVYSISPFLLPRKTEQYNLGLFWCLRQLHHICYH
jgi:hypothetical protein